MNKFLALIFVVAISVSLMACDGDDGAQGPAGTIENIIGPSVILTDGVYTSTLSGETASLDITVVGQTITGTGSILGETFTISGTSFGDGGTINANNGDGACDDLDVEGTFALTTYGDMVITISGTDCVGGAVNSFIGTFTKS